MTKNQEHPQGVVALRRINKHGQLSLTIPIGLSRALVHKEGTLFSVELTEDGIFFRRVDAIADVLPEWASEEE